MAFEITRTFVVKAPSSHVWEFLIDPRRVATCPTGAAIGEKIDDKTYTGTMTVKVGPVSSSYKGKVVFERVDPQARTAEIAASGMDVRGKGGADMRLVSSLREIGPGETEITAVPKDNCTDPRAHMARALVPAAGAAPPPSQEPAALDLGSLGAKAAGRAARRAATRPAVWAGIVILFAIIYALCR